MSNGVPISSWFVEETDSELMQMVPFLESLLDKVLYTVVILLILSSVGRPTLIHKLIRYFVVKENYTVSLIRMFHCIAHYKVHLLISYHSHMHRMMFGHNIRDKYRVHELLPQDSQTVTCQTNDSSELPREH